MLKLVLDILLPAIALTWYATEANGPFDLFLNFRTWVGVGSGKRGFLADLLVCGGCTATWAGGVIGIVQALPFLFDFQYPLWLAWLVRCPLAAAAFVVILDMLKPFPPFDFSKLGGEDGPTGGGTAPTDH